MHKSAFNKARRIIPKQVVKRVLIALIRLYQQVVSPWLGYRCRFYPSCSHYAVDAIRQEGALKGCLLSGRRLLRCHPFNPGGYDPIPSPPRKRLEES